MRISLRKLNSHTCRIIELSVTLSISSPRHNEIAITVKLFDVNFVTLLRDSLQWNMYLIFQILFRTPYTDLYVNIVRNSAESTFGSKSTINLSSAGTGPMNIFVEMLKCPCIAVGCTPLFANIHSYDEYPRIELMNKGVKRS